MSIDHREHRVLRWNREEFLEGSDMTSAKVMQRIIEHVGDKNEHTMPGSKCSGFRAVVVLVSP